MTLAFTSLTPAQTPRGSAAFSVVQRVGAPFGVAVIAVVLQSSLAGAGSMTTAFAHTFWWIVGLSALPLLVVLLVPRSAKSAPLDPRTRPSPR